MEPNILKKIKLGKKYSIIDEFDRHLHTVWQRLLLSKIKKDFHKIQFVLTTHNLFSLQSAEGFQALILDTENKKITVTEKKIKAGLSIKSIYNTYFNGNNHFFSHKIEKLFSEFYILLKKVKLSEATNNEFSQFEKITNKLLEKDEEVQVIISRELRQMERQR